MKTVLYIIRHGNSLGNLTKTFYGHHNGPLTETGHEQAKRVAVYFENKKVDVIYSSDLTAVFVRYMQANGKTGTLTSLSLSIPRNTAYGVMIKPILAVPAVKA